jgi:hypothetical protein
MSATVRLLGPTQRDYAHRLIEGAPADHVMKLGKETRTDAQNRKLWPMIQDIQRQVPEMATFNRNDIKLRFLNALGTELRFLPTLENEGIFPVGLSSSELTVAQFSGLVELLYKWGAEHGVVWTEPKERAA